MFAILCTQVYEKDLMQNVVPLCDKALQLMAPRTWIINKVQFSSLRNVFRKLREDKYIPKHNYTFYVDANKLKTATLFLQEILLITCGVVWDFTLTGNLFKYMHVYERGGKLI